MVEFNPYDAPSSSPLDTSTSGSRVTPLTLRYLRSTRPWVLFLVILGFIACGFLLIASLGFMASGALGDRDDRLVAAIGFVYLVTGGLAIPPLIFLARFSSGINRLLHTERTHELEEALRHQKSYWKTVGLMVLVTMALYLVLLIFSLAFR